MLAHDLRLAFRLILRHPGTSAIAIFTLALGIGATTAIFSVVHAVLLRPLPFPDPDRIVTLWETRPREGVVDSFVSPADVLDWESRARSFASMAALARTTTDLTGEGEPIQLVTGSVTSAFFDVLGTVPMLGRRFAPGDDALGRHRVTILGHGLWQERFGAARDIVGRAVALNGIPHEVVGVLGPRFEFPGERVQLWVPLVLRDNQQPPSRNAHFLQVYGRVASGVSLEQARAEIDAIGRELSMTYPADNANHGAGLIPFAERVAGPVRVGLAALMGAVLFVLLIACANIANLLLSRAAGRRREMAVRAAIGASRRRLLQQTLTESLVIAAIGGAAGLIVASWVMALLAADTPPALAGLGLETIGLNETVLLFAVAACMGTGVAAGILPAWQLAREESAESLRDVGRSPAGLKRRVRYALVVGEIALTTLLLVSAGLTLRSFERVLAQPAGFETADRLTVALTLPRARYADADAVRRVGREIESRLGVIPGVIAAGSNNNLPLTGSDARRGIAVEGFVAQPGEPTRAHIRTVTPDYFQAMGIRLAAGRLFARTDDERATEVVMVNETMARRYWPGQSPVGRRVRLVGEETWREVVGVSGDVRHWGLDREVNPELYMPFDQQPKSAFTFVVHTRAAPLAMLPLVQKQVRDVDRDLPLGSVRTFESVAAQSVASRRWTMTLLAAFAALALVLAAAGIYGVMSHLVALRTPEIGIRMTLGAKPTRILATVLGETLGQATIGVAIGLLLFLGLAGGLRSLLFGVDVSDTATLGTTSALLIATALVAGLVPSLRAMRIDPAIALRAE